MDILLPTAQEVPRIITGHEKTPSPFNPLGIIGADEAGSKPTGALFAQADEDALNIKWLEILDIPLSSSKLWQLVKKYREIQLTFPGQVS